MKKNVNSKTSEYLYNMYLKNKTKVITPWVPESELKKLNIDNSKKETIIGNIKIKKDVIDKRYYLSLVDKKKNYERKWLDEAVDFGKVQKVIEQYKFTKENLLKFKETDLNKDLETHFREYFVNAHRSAGNLRELFDLEIGDIQKNGFVIELKMAKAIKNNAKRYEITGQVKQYLRQFNSKNFMLIIAGEHPDKQNKNIISVEKEIINDFKCNYYFLETI